MITLKIYNDTSWRIYSLNKNFNKKNSSFDFSSYDEISFDTTKASVIPADEVERISLSRSKANIREICLCNDFEYFVTMTVSSQVPQYNRFDLEDCVDNCKKFMHKLKRKSKDFKFIFIIEKHKNGAYHFHGMMKNLPFDDIYTNDFGYLSSHVLDDLGFNSFSKIVDYNKCCNYITKYITKNCCRTENNQVYFCSRGLKRGLTYDIMDFDIRQLFGEKAFVNDYGVFCDFDITRLNYDTLIKLYTEFQKSDSYLKNEKNYFTNLLQLLTSKKFNVIN